MKKLCLALLLSGFIGQIECASRQIIGSITQELKNYRAIVKEQQDLKTALGLEEDSTAQHAINFAEARLSRAELSAMLGKNPEPRLQEHLSGLVALKQRADTLQEKLLANPKPAHLSVEDFVLLKTKNLQQVTFLNAKITEITEKIAAQKK